MHLDLPRRTTHGAHDVGRSACVAALLLLAARREAAGQRRPAATSGAPSAPAASPFDSTFLRGMAWRNIGPLRGGRVTAVAGVPGSPYVFYHGAAGGGVWKTDDAGTTWRNISDVGFGTGAIGAIAVSRSDRNTLYVGTGESSIRGVASGAGDGVYRSRDAGRTWQHVGLAASRQVARIVIDAYNPDVVFVAVQGDRWAPGAERGVYGSSDGGTTWRRLLFVNETSGASDIAMDPTNSRILYAALWDHQRQPWKIRSGGPGSGIWKSVDGGATWARLTDGLPRGVTGKIGLSLSAANPDRVYALVEADSGGLYRSDDAGRTWRRVNAGRDLYARAWYFSTLVADPTNADVVYVLHAPHIRKSIDGGRTFASLPTSHDDNHALWINPLDPRIMVNGNDGGASVSLNGGRTWSSEDNQPTGQFYRVNTDASFPYRVYGAQQDQSTVSIRSRTINEGIRREDWTIQGGCESGHVAFDPADPRFTYAGCYQGSIEEYDNLTGRIRNIQAWPALSLAEPSNELRYRFNWNAPVATSPHDRRVIYHAANVLFRSDDRGASWSAISPDLTRNDRSHQGLGGGPITNEGSGSEMYGTIASVVESPHERGTIWVGTDDGLVQLTRDGGGSWLRVSPPAAGEALVNAIEASPHDPGTAYVVMTRYKFGDQTPRVYRTTDYGRSWTTIVTGLPPGDFVRVVREDPERRGLLYAGSEHGVWFSLDVGAHWQSLQLNLPHVPVTDLQLRDGDLVASTEGRAFWILDDLTAVQRRAAGGAPTGTWLIPPRATYRVSWGPADVADAGRVGLTEALDAGRNPPGGVAIRYVLAAAPDSATPLLLQVVAPGGEVIRILGVRGGAAVGASSGDTAAWLPAGRGLNTVRWNFRSDSMPTVPGIVLWGSTDGYLVAPGRYTVRLTVGADRFETEVAILPDPRLPPLAAGFAEQVAIVRQVHKRVGEIHRAVIELRRARAQVEGLVQRARASTAPAALDSLAGLTIAEIDTLEERLVQPHSKTVQDALNFRAGLSDQFLYLKDVVEASDPPMTRGFSQRLAELEAMWAERSRAVDALWSTRVTGLNALAASHGIVAIVAPVAAVRAPPPAP